MSAIPRLLLRRPLLRRPLLRSPLPAFTLRSASSHQAPKTLSKPTKFTPPSHPSSRPLPRDPVNYPGPPQPPRDPTRRYPGTMPPPNTWMHLLLTSRVLHFYISMGILISLAGFVSVKNFLRTSSFASSVFWEWLHPVASIGSLVTAVKDHVEEESRRVGEMRKKNVGDVDLRGEYRRAHGLEKQGGDGGFGGWAVKSSGREPGSDGAVIVVGASGQGKGDWVEDQIRKTEEEAGLFVEEVEKEVEVVMTGEKKPEGKKSSWW